MTWRPIGNGYEVSSEGVMRTPAGKLVPGYYEAKSSCVMVTLGGREVSLHRLVATAFHGAPPDNSVSSWLVHLDGDRRNGRADNLVWGAKKGELVAVRDGVERRFLTAMDAERELGINRRVIGRSCAGDRPEAAGWSFSWVGGAAKSSPRVPRKRTVIACACGGEARLLKRSLNTVRWECACGKRMTTTLSGELIDDAALRQRDKMRGAIGKDLARKPKKPASRPQRELVDDRTDEEKAAAAHQRYVRSRLEDIRAEREINETISAGY